MDIISHGLYGSAIFGNKNKQQFWLSFGFGVLPDLLAFGLPFATTIAGVVFHGNTIAFSNAGIPNYVHTIYNVSHSLIIWAIVFTVLWLIYKRPIKASYARLLHILVDIPTHSLAFFATPFLWPLSNYQFDGIPWSNKIIFIPNIAILVILYTIFFRRKYKKRKK